MTVLNSTSQLPSLDHIPSIDSQPLFITENTLDQDYGLLQDLDQEF